MQQHYIGKTSVPLDHLKSNPSVSNSLFANDGLAKKNDFIYEHINIERCTFSNVSFNECILKHIDFTHCAFIECYFSKSILENINFRNCKFISCQFSSTSFTNCDFFYTEWESNYIKFSDLYSCLPPKYNNRSRLCKVMARNCILDGNIAEYRKYFFENIKSRENHYKEIILRRDPFYRSYTKLDSFKSIFKLLGSKFNGIIWGHGERISNIIYSCIFIILAYSVIYLKSNEIAILTTDKYLTSLYISFSNFLTTSSSINFSSTFYRYISTFEGFLGISFLGLFVTALFKKINTR
jgi:hypothetical protein